MPTWGTWVILGLLLLFRGLLAAVEAALQALSDVRVKDLEASHPRQGGRLVRLKGDRDATAAALRSGLVLTGFLAAAIGTLVPPRLLDLSLASVAESSALQWLTPLASALLVALLAMLIDVMFRSAAWQRPDSWGLSLSWLASFTVITLHPLVRLLVVPMNVVLRPFGTKVAFQAPTPPLEELEKMLTLQAQKHSLDKGAPALIRGVFELTDKTCRDVMVARTEVVAIDVLTPVSEILTLIAEENHSRIPVYREDIDHMVGILHVRDLVPMLANPQLIVLQDLLRPTAYVPWVKPIGDLLRDMQKQRIHMAIVVDEYGGFSGIVTLEDILREIVGDMGDEFEEEETPFEKQSDGSMLVDATVPHEEFTQALGFDFPDEEEGEFETLGGYLSHLAGAIPDLGEKFNVAGWTFIVHAKQGPKLERIRVYRPKQAAALKKPGVTGESLPAGSSATSSGP